MPPVSPCGLAVDFVRSCFRGSWRFFPSRPDILTKGYHYFVEDDVPTLNAFHSFGSGVWNKDAGLYERYPTGQAMDQPSFWYDGTPPDGAAPAQQIFGDASFSQDLDYPPSPPVNVRNGYDARCFVIFNAGVDLDIEHFLRPDILNVCWQRVLIRLVDLLSSDDPADMATFMAAATLLWSPNFTIHVEPMDTSVDRFAWIDGADYQIILRVGTQDWGELWRQIWHGFNAPEEVGLWSTSRLWFDLSTSFMERMTVLGWSPSKPTTFYGHSKGAAVNWITARRMTDFALPRDVEVLTSGCPKVGDTRMIERGNIASARHIMHERDVVGRVPPPLSLTALFPPNLARAFFGQIALWRSFPVYEMVGDNWGFRFGQPDLGPWQNFEQWIEQLNNNQVPQPFAEHDIHSYAMTMAQYCSVPDFPFSDALWQLLFGLPDNAFGGLMEGGAGGWKPANALGGIKVGGAGQINDRMLTEAGDFMETEGGDIMIVE